LKVSPGKGGFKLQIANNLLNFFYNGGIGLAGEDAAVDGAGAEGGDDVGLGTSIDVADVDAAVA
jgi:hypothetical protein